MSGVTLSPSSHRILTCQSTSMPDELPSTPIVEGCAPHVFSMYLQAGVDHEATRVEFQTRNDSRPVWSVPIWCRHTLQAFCAKQNTVGVGTHWLWGVWRTQRQWTKQQWIKALMLHERGLLSINVKSKYFTLYFAGLKSTFHLVCITSFLVQKQSRWWRSISVSFGMGCRSSGLWVLLLKTQANPGALCQSWSRSRKVAQALFQKTKIGERQLWGR